VFYTSSKPWTAVENLLFIRQAENLLVAEQPDYVTQQVHISTPPDVTQKLRASNLFPPTLVTVKCSGTMVCLWFWQPIVLSIFKPAKDVDLANPPQSSLNQSLLRR
jgi:hypothetical protein